jgi:hypothetical protein
LHGFEHAARQRLRLTLSEPGEIREQHGWTFLSRQEAAQGIRSRTGFVLQRHAGQGFEREHRVSAQHSHLQAFAIRGTWIAGSDAGRMALATEIEPQLAGLRIAHGDSLENGAYAPFRQKARVRRQWGDPAEVHQVKAHVEEPVALL